MNLIQNESSILNATREPTRPHILGIGGTLRSGSTSELALRLALRAAGEQGATTEIITAVDLNLPMYDPANRDLVEPAHRLVESLRAADGLIIATPSYHGGISGLLKNALDYIEELAADASPYCHGKAIGCIVSAAGWQSGAQTLGSLRATAHALRGWPTPLGVTINSLTKPFDLNGEAVDPKLRDQLAILGKQVASFALIARVNQAHL